MIDALLFAVRDAIRSAGFNYGKAECEIMEDGKPPERFGNFFAAVHGGRARPKEGYNKRNLYEQYGFSVTLTMRVTVGDRVGDQQIARDIALVPLGQRQGFDHKADQLRGFLHMNWAMTVLTNQSPASANDNLSAWATGTVYGFATPASYSGADGDPKLVGGEWFGAEPDSEDCGIVQELRFDGAERFQPQTAAVGPFV